MKHTHGTIDYLHHSEEPGYTFSTRLHYLYDGGSDGKPHNARGEAGDAPESPSVDFYGAGIIEVDGRKATEMEMFRLSAFMLDKINGDNKLREGLTERVCEREAEARV